MVNNYTITASRTHGFRPGDRICIVDTRRWWIRLWHWIIRKPKPQLSFYVAEVRDKTTLTILPDREMRPVPPTWVRPRRG